MRDIHCGSILRQFSHMHGDISLTSFSTELRYSLILEWWFGVFHLFLVAWFNCILLLNLRLVSLLILLPKFKRDEFKKFSDVLSAHLFYEIYLIGIHILVLVYDIYFGWCLERSELRRFIHCGVFRVHLDGANGTVLLELIINGRNVSHFLILLTSPIRE